MFGFILGLEKSRGVKIQWKLFNYFCYLTEGHMNPYKICLGHKLTYIVI
jgi:hypothetical protein